MTAPAKLENLQALRALAAGAVIAAHLGALGPGFPVLPTSPGVAGVDVFFVLSGFIMCYVTQHSWGRPAGFLAQRAARIYPLWWLCLVAEAPWIIEYLSKPPDEYFGYVARSWFLLPAFSPSHELLPLLVPGWTLIYEAAFYLVFAALMFGPRRDLGAKLVVVFGAGLAAGHLLPQGSVGAEFLSNPIYLEFALGVFIAQLQARGRVRWPVVSIACASALCILLLTSGGYTREWRWVQYGLPAAAVLLLALKLEADGFRAPRVMVFFGEASYAMYLTHTIVIHHLKPYVGGWHGLVLLALACVVCAAVVHLVFERPVLLLVKFVRQLGRREPRPAAG